jgi:uncharacterized membrane-anchored protein
VFYVTLHALHAQSLLHKVALLALLPILTFIIVLVLQLASPPYLDTQLQTIVLTVHQIALHVLIFQYVKLVHHQSIY